MGAGNALAVRHGAQSESIVAFSSPVVAEVEAAIEASGNYLSEADRFLVERAGRQLYRLRRLDSYLDALGGSPIDSRGRIRGCMGLVAALERQFLATCRELGMTPLARAQFVGDLAGARRDAQAAATAREMAQRYGPKPAEAAS